jgi:hypothetical protein
MTALPPLGRRPKPVSQPSADTLAAIKRTGRLRLTRATTVGATVLATSTLVGGIALSVQHAGSRTPGQALSSSTPSSTPDPRAGRQAIQDALYTCEGRHGVIVRKAADGSWSAMLPHVDGREARRMDDIEQQCLQELHNTGYNVVVPSQRPNVPVAQVLEVHYQPDTYTNQTQAAVTKCLNRDGVTASAPTTADPPTQQFRYQGTQDDESALIFGCLTEIPGVTVVDPVQPTATTP